MQVPAWNLNQFIDSTAFNNAETTIANSFSTLLQAGYSAGFIHPETTTIGATGLVVSVVGGAGFGLLTSAGIFAQASGTTTGSPSNTYALNFTSLLPSSGTVTAYVLCTPTTIQVNPVQIVGPPPGHPDYNVNFQPYTGYMTNVDSLTITASNVAPNNTSTFALASCTLTSGTTGLVFNRSTTLRAGPLTNTPVVAASGSLAFNVGTALQVTNLTAASSITLPLVSGYNGVPFSVSSSTSGAVTLNAQGSDLIFGTAASQGVGVASIPLPAGSSITLLGELGGWYINSGSADALGQARTRLNASLTLFVSLTGSDSANNGLSIGSPFATIQHAYTVLQSTYDLNGKQVTIQLANGTYTNNLLFAEGLITGQIGPIILNGNSGSPSSVILNSTLANGVCVGSVEGAFISVQGLQVQASGSNGLGLSATNFGRIDFGNLVFAACALAQISANAQGLIYVTANYTISGNSPQHVLSVNASVINLDGATITLTGTPAFSGAFASATITATINFNGANVFSGSATGPRYNAAMNGAIWTVGQGATFLPGNAVGTLTTGGQYQ